MVAPCSKRRHERFEQDLQLDTQKEDCQCTCNVILWRVRVTFIPPRLPQEPDIILLEEIVFKGDLTSPATMKHT